MMITRAGLTKCLRTIQCAYLAERKVIKSARTMTSSLRWEGPLISYQKKRKSFRKKSGKSPGILGNFPNCSVSSIVDFPRNPPPQMSVIPLGIPIPFPLSWYQRLEERNRFQIAAAIQMGPLREDPSVNHRRHFFVTKLLHFE